jgi:hypothetical protein
VKQRLIHIGSAWVAPFAQQEMLDRFRKAMLLFTLFWAVSSLPVAEALFGPDAWLPAPDHGTSPTAMALGMLSYPAVQPYWYLFMAVCIAACITGLLGYYRSLSLFLAWFTCSVLIMRAHLFHSSGNQLAALFLLYLTPAWFPLGQSWKPLLMRWSLWMCRMQVLVVYVVSSVYKLQGSDWLDGSALYHVLSIEQFALHPVTDWMIASPFWFKLFTWSALGYQLLFPILVWVKPVKKWLLLVGVLFHLAIALLMGVADFGIVMILSYLLFWQPKREALPAK